MTEPVGSNQIDDSWLMVSFIISKENVGWYSRRTDFFLIILASKLFETTNQINRYKYWICIVLLLFSDTFSFVYNGKYKSIVSCWLSGIVVCRFSRCWIPRSDTRTTYRVWWFRVMYCCLCVPSMLKQNFWLVVWNMTFIFHSVGNVIIPTDELHHFSEG